MNEFELIDMMVEELGDTASGVVLGPGDDAAVTRVPDGCELVSSIDALIADVHFPRAAPAPLIGYRALMVSVSDLAAMGAEPGFALVALNLPESDTSWVRGLVKGLRRAADKTAIKIIGGNVSAGPLCVTVSVHGYVPHGGALTRGGAQPGDAIFVTGQLGGSAAALACGAVADFRDAGEPAGHVRRYFMPEARVTAGMALRGIANSAIDVSDGLLQDLAHVCLASDVGAQIASVDVPVADGADLQHALGGGDDYELCFTVPAARAERLPALGVDTRRIGSIVPGAGIELDGAPVGASGYRHFEQ